MKIEIKITKDVLKRSMWCGVTVKPVSTNCAISLAVRDLFPDASTSTEYIVLDKHGYHCLETPKIATRFINAFDALIHSPEKRLDLPEFSFEIDIPEQVIERIGIQEAKAILQKSETLSLVET